MKPLYIFLHLAKTGGTTFVGHLYQQLGFNRGYYDLGPHGRSERAEKNLPDLSELDQSTKDMIRVVGGHLVYWGVHELFPDREPRYLTFIREPISRVLSHYSFDMSMEPEEQLTFSEWYKKWIPNQMCAFYMDHLKVNTVQEILDRLTEFWHIAFTHKLDESLKYILTEMNLPLEYKNRRVSGEKVSSTTELGYPVNPPLKERYVPTEDELAMIKSGHEQDLRLYQHLLQHVVNGKYIPTKTVI